MSFTLTAKAEADLEAMFDYIAEDSPHYAGRFVRELQLKMQRISLSPRIYRERSELPGDLRSAAHGNYIIFFREKKSHVEIVRVVHAARSLKDLLSD